MKEQATQVTWRGVIDSRPTIMYEDPEHFTFRMRSAEGKYLEVFAPSDLVHKMPKLFALGRSIAITGESVPPGEAPQAPILVFAAQAKEG